jgi:IS5 family transposase
LFDATRKVIELIARLCEKNNLSGWRQFRHNVKQLKKQAFKLQKLKHSTSKNPEKTARKRKEIIQAYERYVRSTKSLIEKAKITCNMLLKTRENVLFISSIDYFIKHAERQMEQITRRVVCGEAIPHNEKVFSVFEPHTEWICKGKAGVPVELGLKIALIEDEFGFILNHQVMRNQTDDQIAVPLVKKTKEKFSSFNSCSFDKGFHSPDNQIKLREILDFVALPKKGKLSKRDAKHELSKEFVECRKNHSAVESCINALEVHGLDKCPDHGIKGFEKYTSLAILARNIQKIGVVLMKRKKRILKKQGFLRDAA